MTTDYAELAQLLRRMSKSSLGTASAAYREASDALDHLSAENARLREVTDEQVEKAAQTLFEIQRRNVVSKGRGLPMWDKEFPEHKDYQRSVVREILTAALQQGDKK